MVPVTAVHEVLLQYITLALLVLVWYCLLLLSLCGFLYITATTAVYCCKHGTSV